MFALARLLGMGFVVLTVVYLCLLFYSRAVRRDRLEAEWDASGGPGDRDDFVKSRLVEYDTALRRKLILGVYVVPSIAIGLLIYFTNFA